MSILGNVTFSAPPMGQRIVIAGVEKVGKTTLACNAPRALLVPLEMGFGAMSVAKTPMLDNLGAVFQLLAELIYAAHNRTLPFMSVVFDTATALERLIHEDVLRRDPNYNKQRNKNALTMEAAHGGYGKAYNLANEAFAAFTAECDKLVHYGVNVIVTCHVFASRVTDPAYGEYDTWDMLLHSPKNNKTYGKREMITQWADMIGFLHEPVHVIVNENAKMSRAVSANRGRVLGVDRTPGYVAGNRYGLTGELPIPSVNGWNHLADLIYKARGIDLFNRD